ncbi:MULTISPECIES: hypothetical protein [unclassified Cryobacterium]|uniref:hypothetical protein n=1 Tax=unclassified Cryobacterium TaxID=2649013 RepID=UPI002AB3A4B0|nr:MULTISPECIES: hypothetical protein [unclassified Cryobacterium]MDY7542599.1 hypothetical protein [Cryobacterium sp. 5B3]MEB0264719.1 hypothetical protein [Cryobacterium sp. 10I5]MEB0273691.1 hypothetical protein [Cryobacterium sp. 5B3]
MTTIATLTGRNLSIHIEGVDEPFIIAPLSGRRGKALTNEFIAICAGASSAVGMEAILRESAGEDVYERVQDELTLFEGESVLTPAFYWQTVLGLEGVNAYLAGGEGLAGAKKALELLILSLGILPTQTAPSTALETLIQKQEPTLRTARSTTTVDRLPANKPRANRAVRKPKPAASPE